MAFLNEFDEDFESELKESDLEGFNCDERLVKELEDLRKEAEAEEEATSFSEERVIQDVLMGMPPQNELKSGFLWTSRTHNYIGRMSKEAFSHRLSLGPKNFPFATSSLLD